MRVCAQIDVSAPPSAVWAFIDDPSRYLHFMAGITRWERASDGPNGLGARYNILMRVGSAEIGSLIEIVEHQPARDMAWTSITGIDQRGRWRLRERSADRTKVELRLAYGVAGGGIAGIIAERLAAPQVTRHLRRSLVELKRQVEHQQLREAAAARREARAAR